MATRARQLLPLILAAGTAWSARPLAAQKGEQRAALSAWETRLRAMDDAEGLARLRAADDSAGGDRTARLLARLRQAFVSFRLGQVTGDRRHYDEALEDFWSVIQEQYGWPYPWYGLGLTKVAMAREGLVPYEAVHQQPGYSYADEAREALNRAIEYDDDFAAPKVALQALARDAEAAVARDSGMVLLDQARAHFGRGDTGAGLRAYQAAAARAASARVRERLRADLAWIADSAELRSFDRTRARELPAWLDRFWERRDVRDLRRPGERVAEHYRRLGYAEEHFARTGSARASLRFERSPAGHRPLDDRAVIYIRHGEPQERAGFNSPFGTAEHLAPQEIGIPDSRYMPERPDDRLSPLPPNLSWKYRRPEGDLIFHFVAHYGHDYRLIESLLDVFSLDTVIQLQMGRKETMGDIAGPAWEDARFAKALVASRSELDPLYARLANSLTIQGSGNLQRERTAGQQSLAIGIGTDSYRHVYAEALEPLIQAYGLARGDGGLILVVVGIAHQRSRARTLALRAAVSTRDDRRLMQVDATLSLVSPAVRGVSAGLIELPVPHGTHRVRVLAADTAGRAAGGATLDDVVVPARAPTLTLSDLVLGEKGGLRWNGPDGPVWLSADGVFASGTAVQLYYQAGGLRAGSTYRTRIELRRVGRRQPVRRIASEFDLVARGDTQSEWRELSLAGLEPGEYALELSLAGPGGRATRNRPIRVR